MFVISLSHQHYLTSTLPYVPSAEKEEVGFMTYTAAKPQGGINKKNNSTNFINVLIFRFSQIILQKAAKNILKYNFIIAICQIVIVVNW